MTQTKATSKPVKTTLAPMLSVRHGARAVDFYKTAFGAKELFLLEDGGSVIAQLSVGASEFWLADESPAHQNFSPETLGGSSAHMVLVVSDPDATFDQAIAAGAAPISAVMDQEYGWRVGRVVDPFGHHWEIGKPLSSGL